MTSRELVLALRELGWKGSDLSHRVGVSENAVSMWRVGKRPVPGAVAAYVRLRLKVRALVEDD